MNSHSFLGLIIQLRPQSKDPHTIKLLTQPCQSTRIHVEKCKTLCKMTKEEQSHECNRSICQYVLKLNTGMAIREFARGFIHLYLIIITFLLTVLCFLYIWEIPFLPSFRIFASKFVWLYGNNMNDKALFFSLICSCKGQTFLIPCH